MELVTDELDSLDRVGIMVKDSLNPDAPEFRLHAKLLLFLSDLRGLQAFMQNGGTPSCYGCLKCWLLHLGKCGVDRKGKTVYSGHFSLLPQSHPLRSPLSKIHLPPDGDFFGRSSDSQAVNSRSIFRYRSHEEIESRLKAPDDDLGPLGALFPGGHTLSVA